MSGHRYARAVVPARTRRDRVGSRSRRPTLAGALAALALLGACSQPAPEDSGAVDQRSSTTTEPRRTVPGPADGAVRVAVGPAEPDTPDPKVLLFGDSVAVLLADELAAELDGPLVVDAVDCRRLDAGFQGPCGGVPAGTVVGASLDTLSANAAGVTDPDIVGVVVLANNAALRAEDLDRAMTALDGFHRVWWVTARVVGPPWQDPNNALLADLAERDPRAGVIDWFAASEGRDWLADGVHPTDEGQAVLAALVAEHVRCDCTP
jgi:hypothetical protein